MILKEIFILLCIIVLNGCASIYTQSHDAYSDVKVDCSESKTISNIYSGFIFDLYCIPAENVGFFCLVDLPMSFIVDTVISPYTIYKQVKYGSWYNKNDCVSKKIVSPRISK